MQPSESTGRPSHPGSPPCARRDDQDDRPGTPPGGVLVVGAHGMVGSALADHLARAGRAVVRTTRSGGGGSLALDLAARPAGWQVPEGLAVAYLCAAVTSIASCRDQAEAAAAVNVAGTEWLAGRVLDAGARVVFPSTSLVFDGSSPHPRFDEPTRPVTAYGRMKAEAERRLLGLEGGVAVLRITKVIGSGMPLLGRWARALAEGLPIEPFSDMVMAPVALPLVIEALDRLGTGGAEGIFHLSASHDVSYADVARRLADRLGADADLVRPVSAVSAGLPADEIVARSALDVGRLTAEFGLSAPDPWHAIDWAIEGILPEAARP